ncbi:hypothetical protein A2917_00120 [Candidatus Nomurabacteria bacterium RIFCSPLOWO2_01_FULL_42_17]|uniref:Uncharacterized protein n=1 Tax=Candidatus Nomurabacteria bacterium RIFCSPLOWO2_01_FULL_42_17 TaxID=1801780 RepID=A0A1F6XNM0_9BACT|nr:MAG: hypothetical protein A2917_00120 [Candidatus Nomurabacteria bacterium RIFCSPLOWO2_01_FULL_42_17]
MNKKRYWLRGGTIFAGIAVVLGIVTSLMESGPLRFLATGPFDALGMGFALVSLIPVTAVYGLMGYNVWSGQTPFQDDNVEMIFYYVITAAFWFLVGAALGWLYGKLKIRAANGNNVFIDIAWILGLIYSLNLLWGMFRMGGLHLNDLITLLISVGFTIFFFRKSRKNKKERDSIMN